MPFPLACPNALDGIGNEPPLCLDTWQDCLNGCSYLDIASGCSRNCGDQLPVLAIDIIAVPFNGRKGLAHAATVIMSRLLLPLPFGNFGKDIQGSPDFC